MEGDEEMEGELGDEGDRQVSPDDSQVSLDQVKKKVNIMCICKYSKPLLYISFI